MSGPPVQQYWMAWGMGPDVAEAMAALGRVAAESGANAVVGVRICVTSWHHTYNSADRIAAYGTAVRY